MHKLIKFAALNAASLTAIWSQSVLADLTDLFGSFETELEEQSALATWTTYNRLVEQEGCRDDMLLDPSLDPRQEGFESACTGQIYTLFSHVREIIHTANEITGEGSTVFSLGSNLEGLGFALRWAAAEEYAAQGTVSSEFVNGQISGLAARMTALRLGARGFNFAAAPGWQGHSGGAASADINQYSRWGGFINYSYGFGDRSPTDTEDAFDFDGSKIHAGFDYIINEHWIAGLAAGYANQTVDFDASQSIVEGGMDSKGFSFMPFVLYQPNNFFFSFSAGYQNMDFDTTRSIRYTSFNPDVPSTDTETVSTTSASMTSLFFESGYSWQKNQWGLEPYFNIRSTDISVDSFVEDDINDSAFDLVVREQDISSMEFTLGLKAQYTITPRQGVYMPWLSLELVSQSEDAPRLIDSYYSNDRSAQTAFQIPTSELDSSYSVISFGLNTVIRGGRQTEADGPIRGGLQGFANYKIITGLEGMSINIFSMGLRYAF